ncbi:MAG: hypothetical protein IJN63_04875 [Clostridia bacterium]|nr:hypothetical protein [Clostridia bacterium]
MNNTRRNIRAEQRLAAQQSAPRRFPVFWVCLLLFVLISVFAISNVLKNVTAFLEEYESVQPKYVEAEVFDTYFKRIDYDLLLKAADRGDGSDLTEFESKEDLITYLKSMYAGKDITYYSISTGAADTATVSLDIKNLGKYFVDQFNSRGDIKYIVKAGEDKIAEFTLVHSESEAKKSKSGFKQYELGDIELFFFPHESVTVKLPKSSTLTVNGIKVSEKYRLADVYEEDENNKRLPDGIEGIVYVAYTVDKLYLKPELAVTDKDGKSIELEYIENDNYYSAGFLYDDSLAAQYSAYVINAIENYAAYMQMDGARADFIDYYDTDSDLWKNIISTENYFVLDHSSYSFKDQKATEFYRYNDDMFSCRVSMTHLLHRWAREDYVDYIDMTLFLRNVNGKYLIFDSFAHE